MKNLYTYPQEIWTLEQCKKISKKRERDGYGTLHPFPGKIAGSASTWPQYGQTIRFNGGAMVDGEIYQSVCMPLPIIPDSFHFVTRVSWGVYLERKPVAN